MTENEVFAHLRAHLLAELPRRRPVLAGVLAVRRTGNQQTTRGTGPELLMVKVAERRYGHPTVFERWNATAGELETVERKHAEMDIQFNALYPPLPTDDPGALAQMTPGDLLGIATDALQMRPFIASLKERNAGVLRITGITNTPFDNDRDQREFSPSFVVTISHVEEYVYPVPVVAGFDVGIKSV